MPKDTINEQKLDKIMEARRTNQPVFNYRIKNIVERTDRVVKNQIVSKGEFKDERGRLVKDGTVYHIHYTKDLKEYFMTGEKHGFLSKLIYPIKKITEFGLYNKLNGQQPLTLKGETIKPTKEDYKRGFYKRHFVIKANDDSSIPFEINRGHLDTSPLYKYVSLKWYIKGNKDKVKEQNNNQKKIASKVISNVGKLLPDFQFFKFEENLSPKELVEKKLGL